MYQTPLTPDRQTFLHVSEGGVAEAVGAEGVALPPGAGGPQHQLKVVQRAAQLLVQLDGSVLRQAVRLITVGAVEPAGPALHTPGGNCLISSTANEKLLSQLVSQSETASFTSQQT